MATYPTPTPATEAFWAAMREAAEAPIREAEAAATAALDAATARGDWR